MSLEPFFTRPLTATASPFALCSHNITIATPPEETWMATRHSLDELGLVESMEIDVIDFLCSRIVMMCSGQDRAVVSG